MRDRAREGRAACTRYERSAKTKEEELPPRGKEGKKDARKRKRETKESAVVKTEEDEITSLSRSATRTENVGRVCPRALREREETNGGRGGESPRRRKGGTGGW